MCGSKFHGSSDCPFNRGSGEGKGKGSSGSILDAPPRDGYGKGKGKKGGKKGKGKGKGKFRKGKGKGKKRYSADDSFDSWYADVSWTGNYHVHKSPFDPDEDEQVAHSHRESRATCLAGDPDSFVASLPFDSD